MCSDCSKHINYKRYIHSYKVEKLVTYVREKKSNFLPSGPGQLIPARQTQEEIMVAQDFLEHFNWHDSEGLGCLITGVRGAGEASGWPQSAAPSRELGVLLLLRRPPWAQVRPGGRASPRLASPVPPASTGSLPAWTGSARTTRAAFRGLHGRGEQEEWLPLTTGVAGAETPGP